MLLYIGSSGRAGGFKSSRVAGGLASPDPADDDEFKNENAACGLQHRSRRRRHDFGFDVKRLPQRQASAAAALARKSGPHREGDRHELSLRERGAGVGMD